MRRDADGRNVLPRTRSVVAGARASRRASAAASASARRSRSACPRATPFSAAAASSTPRCRSAPRARTSTRSRENRGPGASMSARRRPPNVRDRSRARARSRGARSAGGPRRRRTSPRMLGDDAYGDELGVGDKSDDGAVPTARRPLAGGRTAMRRKRGRGAFSSLRFR